MHSKWICRIFFFRWFFGYLYIKKFVRSPFLGWCLKYFGSKFTDSRIPGLKGESLFLYLEFFSFCMQTLLHTNVYVFSIANFFGSHFWFLLALIGHCDSLSLQFFCQTYATDTGRFWADGIFFFSALAYFTNLALIIFHCPLSSHQIHSPPTIQLSIYCIPWLYCATSLNLYLPTDSYNLKPTNCCIPIFTYKFTYLQIATLYLRIHLLIPTNCCIPIWSTFYLRISFTYEKLHLNSYNVVPTNSSTIMNYQHVTSSICRLVDENNQ